MSTHSILYHPRSRSIKAWVKCQRVVWRTEDIDKCHREKYYDKLGSVNLAYILTELGVAHDS